MKNSLFPGLILVLLLSNFQSLTAQYVLDEYYQQGELKYEDHIYKAGIRTAYFKSTDEELSLPIIRLNSGERLTLSFDDLFSDYMEMSYSIIHCNADWQPSSLLPQEYLSNFQDLYITEYAYSLNALIPYTNYQLSFPNENLRILKSGNYILKVFVAGDQDDLVLSRRFMVYEDRVSVSGVVKRPTRVEYMNDRQEVDFTINHPSYNIQNPFQDLTVHLMQNNRYDNAITTLKPQFLQNSQLIYQYDKENTFQGGNEFRFFDLKNLLSLTLNVRKVNRDSVYTAFLKSDQPRPIDKYTVLFDINGGFVIRRLDASDSETEADYAYVDFLLEAPAPYEESDVYLYGRFTDWKLLPEYKLKYDYIRNAYHTRVLLKQGYYNFMYALYDRQGRQADLETIEGSHWETENTYQVLVYNREVGIRYDRLVGFGQLSSEDLY